MKKIYKFGYVTGWFLLLLVLFFVFSMIVFSERIRFIDIVFCVLVIVFSLKYFINKTIFYYSFIIKNDRILIYKRKSLVYQTLIEKLVIKDGLFGCEKLIMINNLGESKIISIDYDAFCIKEFVNNKASINKRNIWYILYLACVILILFATFYSIVFVLPN